MGIKVRMRNINGGPTVYARVQAENLKNARRAMAEAINQRAKILAPYDSKKTKADQHLKYNGRVVHEEASGRSVVLYGDHKIPYARIHELGGWTGRGYHTYITPKHYLERAGDQVAREGINKFKH